MAKEVFEPAGDHVQGGAGRQAPEGEVTVPAGHMHSVLPAGDTCLPGHGVHRDTSALVEEEEKVFAGQPHASKK